MTSLALPPTLTEKQCRSLRLQAFWWTQFAILTSSLAIVIARHPDLSVVRWGLGLLGMPLVCLRARREALAKFHGNESVPLRWAPGFYTVSALSFSSRMLKFLPDWAQIIITLVICTWFVIAYADWIGQNLRTWHIHSGEKRRRAA